MRIIDRRAMVTSLLGGALVATTGLVLAPEPANSTSLTLPASEGVTPVSPVEKAVFVSGGSALHCGGVRVCRVKVDTALRPDERL
jgi:hypothetical protein